MSNLHDKIEIAFRKIKSKGFVETHRLNNTGIGKTFEDLMEIQENNIAGPDFGEFEVKSQRALSKSKVTLFTKAPTYPLNANDQLRLSYGYADRTHSNLTVLRTSLYATDFNSCKGRFGFKLVNNKEKKRVILYVKNLLSNKIVQNNTYWSYNDLKTCLKKLTHLFFVMADTKVRGEKEHFHYKKAEVYLNSKFTKFLKLLDEGNIMFDIRFGAYKSGKLIGKLHDHGSGFRIKRKHIIELFSERIILE